MERQRCPDCLSKGIPRPLYGRYEDPDGQLRCANHSRHPDQVKRRSREGERGELEAKLRKEQGIAGPTKGRGRAAKRKGGELHVVSFPAAAPDEPGEGPPAGGSPVIDFSSADAVTKTMERIVTATLNGQVTADAAKAVHPYCATAQAVRAPKGASNVGDKKRQQKEVRLRVRQPPPAGGAKGDATPVH